MKVQQLTEKKKKKNTLQMPFYTPAMQTITFSTHV